MVFLLAEILMLVNGNDISSLSGSVLQIIIQSVIVPLIDD